MLYKDRLLLVLNMSFHSGFAIKTDALFRPLCVVPEDGRISGNLTVYVCMYLNQYV